MAESETAGMAPLRERVAWCFFDFGNSAFTTIAVTAFGAPYFSVLVGTEPLRIGGWTLHSASLWGLAISTSMILVTLTAPVMGAIADRSGRKRLFLTLYTLLCVAATFGLGLLKPGDRVPAFLIFVVANFAFEGAYVFYNAFLPELTSADKVGRLSGQGWALGYVGGLLALICVRPFIPTTYDAEHSGSASIVYFIAAGWYLVFALPALLLLKERKGTAAPGAQGYVVDAFKELAGTMRSLAKYRPIVIFLVAYFLYTDALTTVIDFTGLYTKQVLEFTPKDNITLFLVLNVVAAPGALLFGSLVDRIGGKKAIRLSLIVWVIVVVGILFTQTRAQFWPVAVLAALVLGATQASSRALMARLAPPERTGEFMGFLSLSGKASAVLGPTLYGVVADAASQAGGPGMGHRVAFGVIGSFFVIAYFVLGRVVDARAESTRAEGGLGPAS